MKPDDIPGPSPLLTASQTLRSPDVPPITSTSRSDIHLTLQRCHHTFRERLNSSKTKGLHWGSIHRWGNAGEHREGCVVESWSPRKKNLLQINLTLNCWCFSGDPRGVPQSWPKLFPIRDAFAHWPGRGCPTPVQAPASWVPVLFHEVSLSWPWIKHPIFRAMRMATEQQGFLFCFVFIFKFSRIRDTLRSLEGGVFP